MSFIKNSTLITIDSINKKINYFRYALISYCLIVLFIIPYETFFPHAKLFLPITAFILILQLLIHKVKIQLIDTIIACLILISSSLPISSFVLFRYTLPICFILIGFSDSKPTILKRSYLNLLYWLCLPSITYQLFVYRKHLFDGVARVTLSVGDPNISGLFILLFFFFCYKNKFKLGIALSLICSILFLSRNYFISLCIFFLIALFEIPLSRVISKINFAYIFLIANILIILLSYYWTANVEVTVGYDTGAGRLFSFSDRSNLERFEANIFLIQSYLKDPVLALQGYRETYGDIFAPLRLLIHQSFLEVIAYTGVPLSCLYFFAFVRVVMRYYHRENFKYIYSYLTFTLFLHSSLQGATLMLFILILSLPSKSKKLNLC